MAINPHDDYEALAKLLYPSIEASGNVYYGQTRKLAVDELFDKNNGGFESWFSANNDHGLSLWNYRSFFNWKLGPLKDTVSMDSGTYGGSDKPLFLKYKITLSDIPVDNIINSGNYNTYETKISLEFLYCVLSQWCSPIMNRNGTYNTYDGRNFYIDLDNMLLYIYVAGYNNIRKPITITKNTDATESPKIWLTIPNSIDEDTFVYCVNGSTWEPYRSDTRITINNNDYIQFKCVKQYSQDSNNYIHFSTDGTVDLSGNVSSLVYNNVTSDYSFYGLFANTNVKDASNLIIQDVCVSSCHKMFENCTNLTNAPVLASQSLSPYCYTQMFSGCTSLTNAPILLARLSQPHCYDRMFYDCTSLQDIECYLELNEYSKDNSTTDWLYNVPSTDECWFSAPHTGIEYGASYVPNGWTIYNDLSYTDYVEAQAIGVDSLPEYYSEDRMHVCGTDSLENGRGYLTEDTLGNMEKSFDENNNHPMNTYNKDGSFNQEIWGYKSFCSPVQFRNGIYTDTLSILSTYESGTSDYLNLDLNGSIIKSAESEINLINYKLSNGFDADGNMFTVSLAGYDTQEKHVECSAELVTVGNYVDDRDAYTCESYISATTDGGRAWSRIHAWRDGCSADVTALVNRNGAKLSLSTTDLEGRSCLDILPSKSRFSGNPVTAEKWGLSDIIANTLRGIGYMDNGSACTEYGAVGTLGLFRVNTYFPKAGNIIAGNYLSLINIQLNNNSLEVTVDTNETMLGTWAALTPVKENSETNNIILAVRIQ